MFGTYHVETGHGAASLDKWIRAHLTTIKAGDLKLLGLVWDGSYHLSRLPPQGQSLLPATVSASLQAPPVEMAQEGFEYLCFRHNIPPAYMRRCDPSIVLPHFEYWRQEHHSEPVRVMIVDNLVMGVVTTRYALVRHLDILNSAHVPTSDGGTVEIGSWAASPRKVSFNMDADARARGPVEAVVAGDALVMGMRVSNSETGWGVLSCRGRVEQAASPASWALLPPQWGQFSKAHLGSAARMQIGFKKTWEDLESNFYKVVEKLEAYAKVATDAKIAAEAVRQIVAVLKMPARTVKDFGKPTTIYEIWTRMLELAASPRYAGWDQVLREAAGSWLLVESEENPLYVTPRRRGP